MTDSLSINTCRHPSDNIQSFNAINDFRIVSIVFRCLFPSKSITQASIMSLCTSSPQDGTCNASNSTVCFSFGICAPRFLLELAGACVI